MSENKDKNRIACVLKAVHASCLLIACIKNRDWLESVVRYKKIGMFTPMRTIIQHGLYLYVINESLMLVNSLNENLASHLRISSPSTSMAPVSCAITINRSI